MKAAVVHSFDQPLSSNSCRSPTPGPEQVLVRIEVCGLCHTDIHAARGDWPVKPSPPFVPGHEGVGIIERVGPGNVMACSRGSSGIALVGICVWRLPLCNSGRDAVRVCSTPATHRRWLRGVHPRVLPPCRERTRRGRPAGRRPADLRWGDDLQGSQGFRRPRGRSCSGVRGGGPGAPRRAICARSRGQR